MKMKTFAIGAIIVSVFVVAMMLFTRRVVIDPTVTIVLSENDKKYKGQVEALSKMPPDGTAADQWFRLSTEIESLELRRMILKAAGAALIFEKKTGYLQF